MGIGPILGINSLTPLSLRGLSSCFLLTSLPLLKIHNKFILTVTRRKAELPLFIVKFSFSLFKSCVSSRYRLGSVRRAFLMSYSRVRRKVSLATWPALGKEI